jgi:hypothetical protein
MKPDQMKGLHRIACKKTRSIKFECGCCAAEPLGTVTRNWIDTVRDMPAKRKISI